MRDRIAYRRYFFNIVHGLFPLNIAHGRYLDCSVRHWTLESLHDFSGLPFKPKIDDMRDALSVTIVHALVGEGAKVRVVGTQVRGEGEALTIPAISIALNSWPFPTPASFGARSPSLRSPRHFSEGKQAPAHRGPRGKSGRYCFGGRTWNFSGPVAPPQANSSRRRSPPGQSPALQIWDLRRYEPSTLITTALSRGDGSFPNRSKVKHQAVLSAGGSA